MEVNIHYPKNSKEMSLLQSKIGDFYGRAVVDYVQNLPCPKEQKIEMLNVVLKNILNAKVQEE